MRDLAEEVADPLLGASVGAARRRTAPESLEEPDAARDEVLGGVAARALDAVERDRDGEPQERARRSVPGLARGALDEVEDPRALLAGKVLRVGARERLERQVTGRDPVVAEVPEVGVVEPVDAARHG